MSLVISKVFTYDMDAGNYIQAVEAADTVALEPAVRQAINNFVVGCKQDGIWDAIKASCILAGARTLTGALVPLAGTAPTNNNFVSGDYDRKTGLVGNGSTKYLNSNRNNNADPQDNQHLSVHVTAVRTITGRFYAGSAFDVPGATAFSDVDFRCRSTSANSPSGNALGLIGVSRSSAASYTARLQGATTSFTKTSQAPGSSVIYIFAGSNPSSPLHTNARLAFYSIGESLDLARLDSRVTDLITAFGAAIP